MPIRSRIVSALALGAALLVSGAAGSSEFGRQPALLGASDRLDEILHWIARGIELTGIAVIVIGAVLATLLFLRRWREAGAIASGYHDYRANLGRGILLGLEFLVAADIIGTVAIDPTLYNLGVLALIVAIRTFLSFALEVEIQGRWPWQQARGGRETRNGPPERGV